MTCSGLLIFQAPVVICEKVVPIAIQRSASCTIVFAPTHPNEPTTPPKRGWVAGRRPRPPHDVLTTGTLTASANACNWAAAQACCTPAPARITGRFAVRSAVRIFSMVDALVPGGSGRVNGSTAHFVWLKIG